MNSLVTKIVLAFLLILPLYSYSQAMPTADFSGTPTSGVKPLNVQFTDLSTTSSGPITNWSWDFGDGVGTSTEQTPSYIYQNAGTYTVSLTVTDSAGSDIETKTGYITVNEPPVADFSGTPTSGANPLTVQFTDASTGVINSWSWDFGDGVGTSTEQNPMYIYNSAGSYTVTLTVTGPGGSDMETKTDYITVYAPPVANFSASPTSGIKPLTVQFTDSSTGLITSWSWDFGNGGTSSAQSPSHIYMDAGLYTITLTVTGPGGTDTEIKAGYITVNELPPVADFTANRTNGIKQFTVEFTDNSQNIINSWAWDFGDGGTSTQQNPYHTYTSVGTYTVTLTVTGPGGSNIMQKTDYIRVTDIVVDHSDGNVDLPQIAADGNGNVYAVWEDTRNGSTDIYFNYSTDYGFTYQPVDIRIDTGTPPGASHSQSPQIACDDSGHVYVVWEDRRNGSSDIYFNYSSNYGAEWQSSDKKLSSIQYAPPPQFPKIACDNTGHVYVAWDNNYFNTCTNYGADCLSQALRISTSGGADTQITCDQNGKVYVAWRSTGILFNYSTNNGSSWPNPDKQVSDPGAIPYGLSLTSDESGNVYCVWHDGRTSASNPDIYFDSASFVGNFEWGQDVMLNTGTPGTIYSIWPVIDSDESGRVYVAWYDRRNNGIGDIYLNYSSDHGTISSWQTQDIRLDTDSPSADSGYPKIASDNAGHIYVIWTDDQESSPGLYTNYSLDYGTTWLSSNRKIGSGGFNPEMTTVGSRFYIVADNSDNNDIIFNEIAPPDVQVPPFLPADPYPSDGAAQVRLAPTLSWRAGDANLDDTLRYDVYFGDTLTPPIVSSDQTQTTFVPTAPLGYFKTYYWQVVVKDDAGGITAGPIWSFGTMSGPPQFTGFSPLDGAQNVGLLPTLSWSAIDPDPGDTLVYDVYFGQTYPPALQTHDHTSNTYGPGILSHYTVYYWQIVAKDNHGDRTIGPILSFTTINHLPQLGNYSPGNSATGVSLAPLLKWNASDSDPDDTLTYDVYFGTESSPPLRATGITTKSYQPGALEHFTVYYWKVVARDNHGGITESPILSFTTLNNLPRFNNFSPPDSSIGVSLTVTLSWSASDYDPDDTLTYDVYLGTVSSPPLIVSDLTTTSYQPGTLAVGTVYYWKVVARDHHGSETSLPVISFTTFNNPPQFIDFSPPHMSTGVSLTPTLSWSASDPDSGDTLTYNIYFGKTSPPPLALSNQTTTTYQPAELSSGTKYYWKIVARDNHGLTTPMQEVYFDTVSAPPLLSNFTPIDGTIDVSVKPALKWSASDPNIGDTITYDVYLGTSSGPPLVVSNLTKKVYRPSELLPFTLYYWRVVARDNHGIETSSTEMTFITGPPAPYIVDVSPNPCRTKQIITITGEYFGDAQGASVIHLGPKEFFAGNLKIKMWSNTRIDFQIPPYNNLFPGTAIVRTLWVVVNGTPSNRIKLSIVKQ